MKATELKSLLENLAELMRAGGAKRSAEDVVLLTDRIDTSDNKSATQAIEKLEAELSAEAAEPVNIAIQRYVDGLKEAGRDEAKFDKIYARLHDDRSIKKDDAIAVMRGYVGQQLRVRTKAQAFEEIQRQFSKLLYDANTERQAASTPW